MSNFAFAVSSGIAQEISVANALTAKCDLVWIHLHSEGDDAHRWLIEQARVPALVADALTATESRPRCEAIGEGALINLRGLSSDAMSISDPLASIRIWALKGRVISVTRKPLQALSPVKALVQAGSANDPGDLIAAMATTITEQLDPDVADLGDTLDNCEEQLEMPRIFEVRRIVTHARARAIGYRRFLSPQRTAIEKLAALPCNWLAEEDRLHLNVAADRAARMVEELESIRERSALLHEALTDLRAEQLDERSLTIAIFAMIFLPVTFVTGLLGMNVEGIPYAGEPWAFWGVVGFCLAIAVAIGLYFIRHRWFRR